MEGSGDHLVSPSRLYAIIDDETLARRQVSAEAFARELRDSGDLWVQWRAKGLSAREVLDGARKIADVFAGSGCRLIMNDRADLAVLAGFAGVHVGQGDLDPEDARTVIGSTRVVGVSTHTETQVIVADAGTADYVAIGPVFATGTKIDAEAVVGLDGVRRARSLTRKPLVAIGGITLDNFVSVLNAGADSVAVISGLFVAGKTVREVAQQFQRFG